MFTIKDVAKRADVSISTVSRVINNPKIVTPEKYERVMRAMKELGYRPNSFAQSLVTKRSNAVGIIVNNLSSPYFGKLMEGIETTFHQSNMHSIIFSAFGKIDVERKGIDFLLNQRCDALLLNLEAISDDEILEIAKQAEVPIVLVGRYIKELSDSCVYFDNKIGGEIATQHLIDNNHTEIALISALSGYRDARQRFDGMKNAMKKAGLKFNEKLLVESGFEDEQAYIATKELLRRNEKFTAIIAGDDEIAAGAIKALRDEGIKTPEEISIVGFDDIPFAKHFYPALTTVRQPTVPMGYAAAELVMNQLKKIESDNVIKKYLPELIKRDSVIKLQK